MTGSHGRLSDSVEALGHIERRLRRLAEDTTARVLAGSTDPDSMALAYAAIGGEASLTDGLQGLRTALRADGVDERSIESIEGLFLNAALSM